FEAQLEYLKRNFNLISIHDLFQHLFQNQKLPNKPLLLTFDDGDISILKNGLPLLQKLTIPSICFVITNLVNSNMPFWWDEIEYYLGKEKGLKKSWEVKKWENKKREIYLQELRNNSPKPPLEILQLTNSDLKRMNENNIHIANHSHTHPMFDKCTIDELKYEIENSTTILNSLGLEGNVFAYPNGNFDESSEKLLLDNKFKMAFLFDHKLNGNLINPLRISRIRVDSSTVIKEFIVKVSGLHSYIFHHKL